MAATTGVAFIISSDAAGGSPGAIGGQRNGSLSITTGQVDLSSKDSSIFKEKGKTSSEWEVTGDGVVLESDSDFTGLEADIIAGNLVDLDIAIPQTTLTFSGEAICTQFQLNAPYEDAYTWSATFVGTGALVKS